eukprot:scaffold403997_cov17-Prasinocladus_malaysianus.AAC.1
MQRGNGCTSYIMAGVCYQSGDGLAGVGRCRIDSASRCVQLACYGLAVLVTLLNDGGCWIDW